MASGVFATNAIVLTRSRGPVIGLALGGVVAIFLSPRRHRWKITLGLIVALAGGYYLTDAGYRNRVSTIGGGPEGRDAASQSRLDVWAAGLAMVRHNPLGVGAGNFQQTVGRYAPQHEGLDAHNTYVRCAGELGVQGFAVLLIIIACAVRSLLKIVRRTARLELPNRDQITYAAFGIFITLVTMMGCGLTATLIYFEAMWWILAMPVCLVRVLENELADAKALPALGPLPEDVVTGAPLASPTGRAPAGQ
jgi:O-antigen ligase